MGKAVRNAVQIVHLQKEIYSLIFMSSYDKNLWLKESESARFRFTMTNFNHIMNSVQKFHWERILQSYYYNDTEGNHKDGMKSNMEISRRRSTIIESFHYRRKPSLSSSGEFNSSGFSLSQSSIQSSPSTSYVKSFLSSSMQFDSIKRNPFLARSFVEEKKGTSWSQLFNSKSQEIHSIGGTSSFSISSNIETNSTAIISSISSSSSSTTTTTTATTSKPLPSSVIKNKEETTRVGFLPINFLRTRSSSSTHT